MITYPSRKPAEREKARKLRWQYKHLPTKARSKRYRPRKKREAKS